MLEKFDDAMEKVTPKHPVPLERIADRLFYTTTTSDDPVMARLAAELPAAKRPRVFATDVLLAHLMTCARSVLPFHVLVRREGNTIFLDKDKEHDDYFADVGEAGMTTRFDFLTVHETAPKQRPDDEPDDPNGHKALCEEATRINQNFSQQVLCRGTRVSDAELGAALRPHPFFDPRHADQGRAPAAVAYRYRKFTVRTRGPGQAAGRAGPGGAPLSLIRVSSCADHVRRRRRRLHLRALRCRTSSWWCARRSTARRRARTRAWS